MVNVRFSMCFHSCPTNCRTSPSMNGIDARRLVHLPFYLLGSQEIPVKKLKELDVNLEKLREFNDAAFHKFSPVCLSLQWKVRNPDEDSCSFM